MVVSKLASFRLFLSENFHFVDAQMRFDHGLADRSRILLTPLSPYRAAPYGFSARAFAAWQSNAKKRLSALWRVIFWDFGDKRISRHNGLASECSRDFATYPLVSPLQ